MLKIKKTLRIITLSAFSIYSAFVYANNTEAFNLTVKVDGLRNSQGVVQFALYNKDDTIPDEEYQKYFRKKIGKINNGSSSIVFNDLPKGRYAINILHDENMDGKIDKGFIMPIEGIGFTNFTSIGFGSRPNFLDASFNITSNVEKIIKIIYL